MAIAEAISVSDLNSLKAVSTLMEKHSLPRVSTQALMTIGTMEGDTFKKALVAIANNTDPQDESKNYVYRVTGLLTKPILEGLATLGFMDLQPSILIKIGKAQAQEFRTMLSKAMHGDKDSQKWLEMKISSYGGGEQPLSNSQTQQQAPAAQSQTQPPQRVTSYSQRDDQPYPANHTSGASTAEREYYSVHLYGKTFALCFQATEKDGEHSVNLDAAKMLEGQRKVNWEEAIHFRFTERELFSMYACLIGMREKVEFNAHGPANDKSFSLKRQDGGFFASCSAKDKGARGVPFGSDEGVRILVLLVRQLLRNHPEHSPESLDRMVRSVMNPRLQAAA